MSDALDTPLELRLLKLGQALLSLFLAGSLILLLGFAHTAPQYAVWLPAAIGMLILAVALFRYPLAHLAVVLLGFALVARRAEGIQVEEVIYGIFYSTYLVYWYITHVFVYRQPLLRTVEDRAVAIFLGYAVLTIPLTFAFGGSVSMLSAELISLSMLAFYFPIKEACRQHPAAIKVMLGVLIGVGVVISVRNLFLYQSVLLHATELFQIARGRVHANEILIMMPALAVLCTMFFTRRQSHRIGLAVLLVLFIGMLIVTQSRGYWASFILGLITLGVFLDNRNRMKLLLWGAGSLALISFIAFMAFSEYVPLITLGVADRFATLETAGQRDISLVNRFIETRAVMEKIASNPVLGYGMGVPFRFYDIIFRATLEVNFIHNGIISLWYKFGIVGLVSMLFFWIRSAIRGAQIFRTRNAPVHYRVAGLIGAVCLISEALVANTSNPFIISDGMLMFALLAGVAVGSWQRYSAERPE